MMRKINIKKSIAVALALTTVLTISTACKSSKSSKSNNEKVIKIAASPTPHAEILEQVKDDLKDLGYELEIVEYQDYIQPNEVVESGEFDANFFQHQPYLDDYNKENGTSLVSVAKIHFEPLGIYPGKSDSLDDIKKGTTIAIPNDTTNEARALLLLEANGLIKLKDDAGLSATVNDILENKYEIDFEELEAAQISRVADEFDFVVLNGNYALDAGFSVANDALAKEEESSDAALAYANIIAVKAGNEDSEKIKALISVLTSYDIKEYINSTYDGAVVPIEQ